MKRMNLIFYQHSPLAHQIIKKNSKQVKRLLNKGANLYLKDSAGHTPADWMQFKSELQPLFIKPLQKANKAILCGKIYLESGFNEKNTSETPLKNAIENAFEKQYLFHQIAKIEHDNDFLNEKSSLPKSQKTYMAFLEFIKACDKIMPEIQLIFAVENKRSKLVKTILDQFISLEQAVKKGKLELVMLFLDNGTPVDLAFANTSMMKLAIQYGYLALVDELLNRTAKLEFDWLCYAVQFNQAAIFHRLIARGMPVPDQKHIQQLFHLAIQYGHLTLLKDLLDMGACVNYKLMKPVQLAINHGQTDILAILLNMNVISINQPIDEDNKTLLHLAIEKSESIPLITIALLKKYGADLEILRKGFSPLQYAYKNPALIEMLLNEGANISATDIHNCSALHVAASKNAMHSVSTLIAHGAEIDGLDLAGNSPLHYAVCSGDMDTVLTLLNHGASIHICNADHYNVLHRAVEKRFLPLVQLFLNQLPLEAFNYRGDTPLLIAAKHSVSDAIFHTLLKAGANLHAKNKLNQSCVSLYPDVCGSLSQLPAKNAAIIKPLGDFIQSVCQRTLDQPMRASLKQILYEMEHEAQKFYAITLENWRLQIESILKLHEPANFFAAFFSSSEPNFRLEFEILCRDLTSDASDVKASEKTIVI
jgi:ankyrin repeat protein